MYKLRYYQQQCHDNTMSFLNGPKSHIPGLIIIPTGTGKSLNIAKVVEHYDGPTIILCPSIEILKQNYQKYLDFGGKAELYSASLAKRGIGETTFASIQSTKNLVEHFKKVENLLVVVDEAHENTDTRKGMFHDFIKKVKPTSVLGYTATPFRLSSHTDMAGFNYSQLNMLSNLRPAFFKEYIHITQIPYAVDNGYWAPTVKFDEEFDSSGLLLNKSGHEFTPESIQKVIAQNNINNRIYLLTKKLLREGETSILLFLDTVENCYKMVAHLGEMAKVVEAKTKTKEREQILEDFKIGKVKVVCCVSTLTTGFDFPELDIVMMGRPTNSFSVFYQVYGRGVRPFGDKVFRFYDFGGNLKRFGEIEELTIENLKGYGWGMFSGDNLLTGRPMDGSIITKEELVQMAKTAYKVGSSEVFEFGKWKNQPIDKIPLTYISWALENARKNMTLPLINLCKKRMTTI